MRTLIAHTVNAYMAMLLVTLFASIATMSIVHSIEKADYLFYGNNDPFSLDL